MQRAISLGTHFCISAAKRFVFFMRNIYVIVTLYVAAMLLLLQLQIRIYFDSHSLRINFHISLPFFFCFSMQSNLSVVPCLWPSSHQSSTETISTSATQRFHILQEQSRRMFENCTEYDTCYWVQFCCCIYYYFFV